MDSPRDRHLVVFGRKPVLEALTGGLPVARVHLAERVRGDVIDEIVAAARDRGIETLWVPQQRVTAIARSGRHHQGVVADIRVERMRSLAAFVDQRRGRLHDTEVLVLDRVHNPANVGMILRSAVAADLDGVVVPDAGTAELGPLVIKASAGVAFKAPLLRTPTTEDALDQLAEARFELVALDDGGEDLFAATLSSRTAYVVGNETEGLSARTRSRMDRVVSLPLANGVESLNVAVAASVLAYELHRRRCPGS